MNAAESMLITRFVKAACPQQKMDEYTIDAWFKLLKNLNYVDCEEAVENLGNTQAFIAPAEIRAEVTRIRGERIRRVPENIPALDANPEDVAAFLATLREARRRMGDGGDPDETPEYPARDVAKLIEGTVAKMPEMPTAKELAMQAFDDVLATKRAKRVAAEADKARADEAQAKRESETSA